MTSVVSISLPVEVAKAIPKIIEHENTSFSGFVRKSMIDKLNEIDEEKGVRERKGVK